MHEWALAEAIVNTASEIAERERLKEITQIVVRVGELQQIEKDILEFCLSQVKTSKLKKTKIRIVIEKAKLRCRVCGHNWTFSNSGLDESVSEAIHFVPEIAHTYIKCPGCSSPDFEIVEGRGITLQSVKGVR